MPTGPHTHIFDLWVDHHQIAGDVGVDSGLAAVWRHRGRFPPDTWHRVERAAKTRGFEGITAELLSRLSDGWSETAEHLTPTIPSAEASR